MIDPYDSGELELAIVKRRASDRFWNDISITGKSIVMGLFCGVLVALGWIIKGLFYVSIFKAAGN